MLNVFDECDIAETCDFPVHAGTGMTCVDTGATTPINKRGNCIIGLVSIIWIQCWQQCAHSRDKNHDNDSQEEGLRLRVGGLPYFLSLQSTEWPLKGPNLP